MVAVAQLVEHRIVIPVVAGSIPVSHPIFQKAVHQGRLFCSVLFSLFAPFGLYLQGCITSAGN